MTLPAFQQKYLQASDLSAIAGKVFRGERISMEDGRWLYATRDLTALGILANWKREQLNDNRAYFIINRYLTKTNICTAGCTF